MIRPERVLFVFLDGVGLGPDDRTRNPLSALDLPTFRRLAGGDRWTEDAQSVTASDHVFRPLDANLGVEGLPQSGTGQATLFSGVNCAALAGRHYGPYPHSTSKPVLTEQSVFARLIQAGHPKERLAFANAYPQRFFVHAWKRKRWTVTTFCCNAAGIELRSSVDLRAGEAVAADMTGERWQRYLDPDMPVITEAVAARRFYRLAEPTVFSLFEHYLTDKIGHAQDWEAATLLLRSIDRFLGALVDELDPARDLLLLSSDHGNIEDLSTKSHTRHPVPLVAWGAGAEAFATAESLTGVTPLVVSALANESGALS